MIAKLPAHAFVGISKFEARVYVDSEYFVDLLKKHGYLTFMISLIDARALR